MQLADGDLIRQEHAGAAPCNPRLWWPNGYGAQNLYTLHLDFRVAAMISDSQDVPFGVRKITYSVPGTDT